MRERARAFAPASIANLAIGYDTMGLAIHGPGDEVEVRRSETPGVRISVIHGADAKLPMDAPMNTAGRAVIEMLADATDVEGGIEIEIWKKMPFGSGMGSSAASAAAAVKATDALLGHRYEEAELAHYAMLGESVASGSIHGDNVIPSLLGGLILIRDNEPADIIRLPIPKGLCVMLVHPDMQILTSEARGLLSAQVDLSASIRQTANAASFVHALHIGDLSLLSRSLEDHLIEPQRKQLIPHFDELQSAAIEAGALNFTISGAGPSMFAFCDGLVIAEEVGQRVSTILAQQGIGARVYSSEINTSGAQLI